MSRDKGQSLISIVLFTGIVLAGIGTVVTVAGPAIDNFQDAIAIDTAQDIISGIGSQVERVAEGGKGSQLNLSVSFDRGNLIFDSEDNEIEYRIDTETEIIAPHTSRRFGDLLMSATASVSVNRETVDGQDCWRIENEHIQTCIRAVDEPDDSIGSDTVGFWRFTNESGQTVVDNSSYGNSGTLGSSTVSETSDPSRVGGLRGKALEFDGNDDYVEIPDDESLDITEGLTVSGWFRFDETPAAVGEDIGIFSKNDITGSPTDIGPYGSIWRDGEGVWWRLVDSDDNYLLIRDTFTPNTGEWYHILYTYDGGTSSNSAKMYVNGQLEGTDSGVGELKTNSDNLWIGNDEGSNTFPGKIDELRIYNRSLSPEEVRYLYNSTGYLDYVDTRDLILSYRNKDEGKNLSADFKAQINTGIEDKGREELLTMNGTGTVTPALTGEHLGRGRITADIYSFYGIDYQIVFQMFSGSDFLQAKVEENLR